MTEFKIFLCSIGIFSGVVCWLAAIVEKNRSAAIGWGSAIILFINSLLLEIWP